ncbi:MULTISPECIES: ABC transporter substrate-binding protein [unclassified Kitasatospora]|uniref:ABC transporter substrate-binding protein n=1 Tax=unclassified Kitasatospora TaxID=2633591 RepID=UPI00070B9D0E|nr:MULTISPECIES: extracellular solute-binding protein [unclassified Kitasatospora]KQV13299.1 sugar ABC transporter substrate-binding protein [Kitasatospora sp. Root107]KRB75254.1 sugar ABC transporter substrate-binding protein [Kitasatospora sp. Root187]
MKKRSTALAAAVVMSMAAVSACSGGGGAGGTGGAAVAPADPTKVSGDITVLTHKTDLAADGTLAGYAAEFNKIYPNVHVKFEPIVNYEGDVKIRLNSSNYGDVLMIPAAVPVPDYPKFFAPLGTPADLDQKYRFIDGGTYSGQVYGIAINGNATGMVYNKAVWQQAGISNWPTTPDEFRADLQAIKAKTQATPLYTIYHEGWPITAWQSYLGEAGCDPAANDKLAADTAPWAAGKELNGIDTLLYNVVHDQLTEKDPTTTTWDAAKSQLGTGKIGTLPLASWAISQMKAAAKTGGADPADIGFMPFPAQANGHFCSVISPDYRQAVSTHSRHKEAARAWVDWFVDKSTYAQEQALLPTLKAGALPDELKAYQDAGVQFIQLSQTKNADVSKIDNQSEIGLNKPDYRQHIVDLARGAGSGSLDGYFAELNKKWATAIKTVG